MKRSYDLWLLTQADKYYSDCKPRVISTDYEVDYDDGVMINIPIPIMNCESCDNCDCEYWSKYNE